jgi:23S rRNA (cytosine1962-C5)-methyltransferase
VDDYELLDAGDRSRLERFGTHVVARPAAGATEARRDPAAWREATLVFDPQRGWEGPRPSEPWTIMLEGLTVELRPTANGQVGVFPEQAPSWTWLRELVAPRAVRTEPGHTDRPSVLNLFAYTGLATLALAGAGAAVTHVDASRPAVAWARRNAARSGLEDRPVRWIVDDVPLFVARELRRGRRYDGVILDPPTYGHGARGRPWRLEDDLGSLLIDCARLVGGPAGFALLSAHTPGFGPDVLATVLADAFGVPARRVSSGPLSIVARSGAHLELGAFARSAGGA